jgi:rod shape-determining protein MreD
MNRDRASRRLPVLMSYIFALVLTLMPLPDVIEAYRPDWIAMLVIYWAMQLPRTWSVGSAWLLGIVLDVSLGTLLGQHALALCCVAFITVRFHLLMRVFPIAQLTATVLPILATYQFLLFWINGVSAIGAPSIAYWGPVISGTLMWPIVMIFLSGVHYRTHSGA